MNSKILLKNTCHAIVLLALSTLTLGAEEIDWERAKALRLKLRNGQSLSQEDDAYLKKAMEARSGSRTPTTRGDGTGEKPTVSPIRVSEEDSPVKSLSVTAADGNKLEISYRAPQADRPLPAVVFFHGGLGKRQPRQLMESARTNPTHTRFLAAGYVAVSATFRTYGEEPQSRGPILDAIATVQAVKKLPQVDPESVIVYGGSGGGSIALELAGDKDASPLAVIAGEPACVLFTGVMTSIANRESSMKEYPTLYNDKLRAATEKKINAISCPILIHHGDTHPLKKINFDLVFPSIQKAGKTIVIKTYPGEDHGFYWGNKTTEKTLDSVISNTIEFIEPLLKSKPAAKSH